MTGIVLQDSSRSGTILCSSWPFEPKLRYVDVMSDTWNLRLYNILFVKPVEVPPSTNLAGNFALFHTLSSTWNQDAIVTLDCTVLLHTLLTHSKIRISKDTFVCKVRN